ncbi:MAG: M3 family peptidase, partial [Deltaproteobacteria bacterium]|nr:M3 family peptidase [Deltaproteobacteria bacterium]
MAGSTSSDNPLLRLNRNIPFDEILPEHVEPAINALLEESRAALAEISKQTEGVSFKSSLLALESATEELEIAATVVGHLESVATTPELREAYNQVDPLISEFYSSIPLDEGLWNTLKAFEKTQEASQLSGARKRFF